tara:strand:+ start:60901 stop:61365 length:465 start_codon:yes stop_codon:yes gene_type:complete
MKTFPDIPNQRNEPVLSISNISNTEIPVPKNRFESVLKAVEDQENIRFQEIELVYVDENEIVRINREHLNKEYVTDIITFRYDEGLNRQIEGTLFCCSPRIKEQSIEFGTLESVEFLRIFAHGLLHLAGYDDRTIDQKTIMTQKENEILELINS